MNAVDTNVWVYSIDTHEPAKRQKALELLGGLSQGAVPTVLLFQVAGEYLSCLRKWEGQGRLARHEVEGHLNHALALFSLVIPGDQLFSVSLGLSSRYSLSHWDSMLLAACIDAGVDTLYSEDLGDGTRYDTVLVVNPFA